MSADVRTPVVAGTFYPGSPGTLRDQVDRLLSEAPDLDVDGEIVALVSPHAGYVYSGATAATAYRQIQGHDYDAIVVIAPSHREVFHGVSVKKHGAYATPLGELPVHEQLAARIIELDPGATDSDRGHGDEHAVEVQLPFIQRSLGDVPIVPIVMLERTWATCRSLAQAIRDASADLRVLVVASSDLYHGHDTTECDERDRHTLQQAVGVSAEAFCKEMTDNLAEACGGGPIAVAKAYAELLGADRGTVLTHSTSADVTGAREGYIVGYGAVVYSVPEVEDEGLTADEQTTLLQVARETIERCARGDTPPDPPTDMPGLMEERGAFVSLYLSGELRGCIGQMRGHGPLVQTVIDMAESASMNDPRFSSVEPDEVQKLSIEISVLSPLRKIESTDEIVVGKHGVIVEGKGRRGVLLPQVPVNYGWNHRQYMERLCLKAGLPSSAWKDTDMEFVVFTADVFGE